MTRGKLEVLLVGAKGLDNTDFFRKGSEPEWNETFVFSISEGVEELFLKIMDSDSVGEDDFVGEAKIAIEPVFSEGSIPTTCYNVVKDEEYCGEIRVGLTFTPEEYSERGCEEESFGGWNESSY
ncbi:elicitor-responsive protein 3 isoform X2 [Lycium barbarum]|uniref:elicitor-responsive protein 3 isoform X2 n=1 Tax=Lycium barbarum TaxID=112863 RepID=UPI00293F1136|nr:elicitor-responsive protein 3 isoform X2 [Lycium barbarum]